ncbi:Secreted RxLR effector peptide protein, partial [Phytophthora palmivora]
NLLGLNKEGDKLFESPVFSAWLSYLDKVNAANPDESMFLVLKAHYGDKGMEKMITIANANKRTESIASKLKEEIWRSQGKSDDDIFNIFKLKEKGGDMFKTTEYAAWASYATKLNKLDKNPDGFVLVEKLKEHFGDVGLARVLAKTKMASFQDNETLKIVSDLQTQQFKQWWSDGKDNEVVFIMLNAAKFDPRSDTRIVLDFADFYKAKDDDDSEFVSLAVIHCK